MNKILIATVLTLTLCSCSTYSSGAPDAPEPQVIDVLTAEESKERAVDYLESRSLDWGEPVMHTLHGDDYWVHFQTPQREMRRLGARVIIVNRQNGLARFLLRR